MSQAGMHTKIKAANQLAASLLSTCSPGVYPLSKAGALYTTHTRFLGGGRFMKPCSNAAMRRRMSHRRTGDLSPLTVQTAQPRRPAWLIYMPKFPNKQKKHASQQTKACKYHDCFLTITPILTTAHKIVLILITAALEKAECFVVITLTCQAKYLPACCQTSIYPSRISCDFAFPR